MHFFNFNFTQVIEPRGNNNKVSRDHIADRPCRFLNRKARIIEEMECQPHETLALAELEDGEELPNLAGVESKLEKLKSERERLGAVNLRADFEQTEISEQRDALIAERDDLVEAIRRLRSGIASLNKEGRERLLEAFDVVNAQFQRLFTHLFGGGTAELQLIESDDPLEAGLEILARPPGKKPQTMTLLSGGEQALTAMALIFAVFLTNPSPICVLDEVDAPLDDANVDRFCTMMERMAEETERVIAERRLRIVLRVTDIDIGMFGLQFLDMRAAILVCRCGEYRDDRIGQRCVAVELSG